MIKSVIKACSIAFLSLTIGTQLVNAQLPHITQPSSKTSIFLRSKNTFNGGYSWQMQKASAISNDGNIISTASDNSTNWQPAIVPGTVLNSLVANKAFPEPYYGDNNRKARHLIPDLADCGIAYYHYWFRTAFKVPKTFTNKRTWLKFHGINYRCEIWLNGKKLGKIAGMFNAQNFDVTDLITSSGDNVLAVDVLPIDFAGSYDKGNPNRPGAIGENHNGGDGEIGKNVTMLMSVGWDFTSPDGVRDRNTGIWRDVELYQTGDVILEHPFVQTKLSLSDTLNAFETVSVEVTNASDKVQKGFITGAISGNKLDFKKPITLAPHENRTVVFSPKEYKQLNIHEPKLWWPINKGKQNLYTLTLKFVTNQLAESHTISTRFGIREITSDQKTPDSSRRFLVNGVPIFIRGTNWVPEAMLRNTEARTYAELKYTKQSGVNLLRLWAGGIAESDYFYQLCDEFGLLVWNEFWITGDTKFPVDTALYFKNFVSTVKRIRSHASIAYYVAANESGEIKGTASLIKALDSTIGYQVQSECCGVHDGSPYKYENPMQYFENTASKRGSRVDGFNPEYGTLCLPIVESLRKMMPKKDLWPINDTVWKYLDGNGFHQVITKYRQAVNEFGTSSSIEEFAKKAQFVGALNYRAIWEVWNYNKFNYGDRFASGFLFWYHNSPLPQTASRMYDWYLEPTAALYYSQNALEPLHPQFDYLKNTVSVYNDYRKAFSNYKVEASIYNLQAKKISTQSATINIPQDGVVNDALKLQFPYTITQVHFIKLKLMNEKGVVVSDAFYWRSKDKYAGAWTLTGPAVSGFSDIGKLEKVTLKVTTKNGEKSTLLTTVSNPSKSISFFTQLKLQNIDGTNISPSYYSDNFFCLLPGESKTIKINYPSESIIGTKYRLVIDGWNVNEQTQIFDKK